jgi:hypothetical protein
MMEIMGGVKFIKPLVPPGAPTCSHESRIAPQLGFLYYVSWNMSTLLHIIALFSTKTSFASEFSGAI